MAHRERESHDRINGADSGSPRYSGFVILRLIRPAQTGDDLLELARERGWEDLTSILQKYRLPAWRLIRSVSTAKLLQWEEEAAQSNRPPRHSLTSYWRVDTRQQLDKIDQIVRSFNASRKVDLAYRELSVSSPVGDPNPADGQDQGHLDPAPLGIDARWIWEQGYGGQGVNLVDLEQGWNMDHEDLRYQLTANPDPISGTNFNDVPERNHGTAVLGIVTAEHNGTGVVGIAPDLDSVRVVSRYREDCDCGDNVAEAIAAAVDVMGYGDILCVEAQRDYQPVEIDDADYDAIALASSQGIIVIEAAGDGGGLNGTLETRYAILDRNNMADFRDSGAIVVTGALSSLSTDGNGHDRVFALNFGNRVDCYAWGEDVVTCGYGGWNPGNGATGQYTDSFADTSSATAIVAGAAAVLQSMYKDRIGTTLSPEEMRSLLSDRTLNTPQGVKYPEVENIGVMPNLRAIATHLGLVQDVYMRDDLADTGEEPSTGAISASPDIIVRPAASADPDTDFGGANENSETLGYEVTEGQDNYIYVRLKNRGLADADDVTAKVYWSETSTLVTPDLWQENLIGEVSVNVPAGNTMVISSPITWPAAVVPATGHYCFVGILDHPQDLAPEIPASTDWEGFESFIRDYNNVTWRNFNVMSQAEGEWEPMPFLMAGAPDRRRTFHFEIIQDLPPGASAKLEVPPGLVRSLLGGRQWPVASVELDDRRRASSIELPRARRLLFQGVDLNHEKHPCRFIIEGSVPGGHRLTIRQIYEGREVGRITWLFHRRR